MFTYKNRFINSVFLMIIEFVEVAIFTITIEWLVVFVVTKTKLIDKFMPKQNPHNSYVQFKSSGIDIHMEGNAIEAVQSLVNIVFPKENTNDIVERRISNSINRNIEKITDAMLSNKNVQKQIQKRIFKSLKTTLNDKLK